jgi:segregation and condensation protein B
MTSPAASQAPLAAVPDTAPPPQPPAPRPRRQRAAPPAAAADPAALAPSIEAILLTTDRPVPAARLAEALRLVPPPDPDNDASPRDSAAAAAAADAVRSAIDHLNAQYEQTGRSFRVEAVAGGFRLMTLPAFADAVAAFQGVRSRSSLTHAALETLAIVAYRQPITRARLEAIRGVACGDILRSLVDRRLVTIAGRAEELGRPILYATTRQFLELFGLTSLRDLPSVEELRARAAGEPAA